MDQREELLPCPFCGSSASVQTGCISARIVCTNMSCQAAQKPHQRQDVAEARWNRRTAGWERSPAGESAGVAVLLACFEVEDGRAVAFEHRRMDDLFEAVNALAARASQPSANM